MTDDEEPPAFSAAFPLDLPEEEAAPKAAAPEKPKTLLPAAAQRLPEDNYVIGPDYLRKSRNISFRWEDVPWANSYIFSIRDASGRQILSAGPSAETSYNLDLRTMSGGSFVWQVEALRRNGDAIEQRGIPAANRFTVDFPLPGNPRVRDPGILYGIEP
jgi:hypothetical protein